MRRRLTVKAKEFDEDTVVERLHFVGHSMGAIVVRRALTIAQPRKVGRVVLLAPPNRGVRLADLAVRLFGRRPVAATELCSHPDSYVNRLARAPDLGCGVIAESWDHAISLASTHLPGQRNHLVLRSLHTLPLHLAHASASGLLLALRSFPATLRTAILSSSPARIPTTITRHE